MKEVNEECLLKHILVSNDNKRWYSAIFCGFIDFRESGSYYMVLCVDNHDNTVYGYDSSDDYKYAKRDPDITYGDEND